MQSIQFDEFGWTCAGTQETVTTTKVLTISVTSQSFLACIMDRALCRLAVVVFAAWAGFQALCRQQGPGLIHLGTDRLDEPGGLHAEGNVNSWARDLLACGFPGPGSVPAGIHTPLLCGRDHTESQCPSSPGPCVVSTLRTRTPMAQSSRPPAAPQSPCVCPCAEAPSQQPDTFVTRAALTFPLPGLLFQASCVRELV